MNETQMMIMELSEKVDKLSADNKMMLECIKALTEKLNEMQNMQGMQGEVLNELSHNSKNNESNEPRVSPFKY